MGNKINLQKPGFSIINDNNCNLIMLLKYYKLLQYFGHDNLFVNLCTNLFSHYDKIISYSIKKKFYHIQKNNINIGKLCMINVYDHNYLYGFILFELNSTTSDASNVHVILPESYSENVYEYLDQIFIFINYNDIIYIENIKDIKFIEFSPDIINIDFCNYLYDCKKYYDDIFKIYNILEPVDAFLFLCDKIKVNDIDLNFKTNDLKYELNHGVIFCLIKLLFNENITKEQSYSSMFDIGYVIYGNEYEFYKNLYIKLDNHIK